VAPGTAYRLLGVQVTLLATEVAFPLTSSRGSPYRFCGRGGPR
jgi:hypothetical protein